MTVSFLVCSMNSCRNLFKSAKIHKKEKNKHGIDLNSSNLLITGQVPKKALYFINKKGKLSIGLRSFK